MKFADEKGLQTSQWYPNMILRDVDINFLGRADYIRMTSILSVIARRSAESDTLSYAIGGLTLTHTTTLTMTIDAGMVVKFGGYYLQNASVWGYTVGAGKSFFVAVGDNQSIAVSAGGTLDRIDLIEVRPVEVDYDSASRSFKDPVTSLVTTSSINIKKEYGYEFAVREGTESATPVANSVTSGWVKIAEVYVAGSASSITQSDIKDIRDSHLWTTDPGSVVYSSDRVHYSQLAIGSTYDISKYRFDTMFLDIASGSAPGTVTLNGYPRAGSRVVVYNSVSGDVTLAGTSGFSNVLSLNDYVENVSTGSGFRNIGVVTSFIKTLLDDTDSTTARATLEIEPVVWIGSRDVASGTSVTLDKAEVSAMSTTRIAVITESGTDCTLSAYDWDGTTWTLVGSSFTLTGYNYPTVTAFSSTDVAILDGASEYLEMYTFNGSTWSLVDGQLTSGIVIGQPSISVDSPTTGVWLAVANTGRLYSWRWLGSVWNGTYSNYVNLTGGVHVGGKYHVAAIDSLTCAVLDPVDATLETYAASGAFYGAISKVGNTYSLTGLGSVAALASVGVNDVIVYDTTLDLIQRLRWDGTDWTLLMSEKLSTTAVSLGLAALNGIDYVVVDDAANTITTRRYDYALPSMKSYTLVGGF